jgi:hypothetical protein
LHVWLELVSRESVFFALVAVLGLGPAAFLPERFDTTARLALAPVLGLCVGACLTVTLAYWFPGSRSGWVLVVLPIASAGLAWSRRGPRMWWPGGAGALQLALVVVVIIGSFDYPLAVRDTVGPAGGYTIADTDERGGAGVDSPRRGQPTSLRGPFARAVGEPAAA